MGKCLAGLFALAFIALFAPSDAFADKLYEYAMPGYGGELKLANTPDGLFLSVETGDANGYTCELSGYECERKGSQYFCQPHEGGDPALAPIILKIMPDKSLILTEAPGARSPDGFGEFCGLRGRMTGKYVPAR